LKGYIRLPIITKSEGRSLVETTIEAYIVPNMSVPILLGEDYQLNYELTAHRSVAEGCRISYKNDPSLTVKATRVDKTNDFKHLCASTHALQKELEHMVQAARDIHIKPHSSQNVAMIGPFDEPRDWIIECNLSEGPNATFLVIPNVLINSKTPLIPVANTSSIPQIIQKGEVLGRAHRPEEYMDKAEGPEQREYFKRTTLLVQ
ncbi:hypothetical protein EDD85DRAFT_782752, partial [Armillaria nabsnona]